MQKFDSLSFDVGSRSTQNYGRYPLKRRISLKKILLIIGLAFTMLTLALERPAMADETNVGAKIFTTNCAACHMNGRNVVAAAKTLKKDALEKYNMNSMEAIVHQVQNGKNAMPAFKNRLNDKQIEEVAGYVLEQAEKGWT